MAVRGAECSRSCQRGNRRYCLAAEDVSRPLARGMHRGQTRALDTSKGAFPEAGGSGATITQQYAGSQKRFSENWSCAGLPNSEPEQRRGFACIGLVTDVTDSPVIPVSRVRAGAGATLHRRQPVTSVTRVTRRSTRHFLRSSRERKAKLMKSKQNTTGNPLLTQQNSSSKQANCNASMKLRSQTSGRSGFHAQKRLSSFSTPSQHLKPNAGP